MFLAEKVKITSENLLFILESYFGRLERKI